MYGIITTKLSTYSIDFMAKLSHSQKKSKWNVKTLAAKRVYSRRTDLATDGNNTLFDESLIDDVCNYCGFGGVFVSL